MSPPCSPSVTGEGGVSGPGIVTVSAEIRDDAISGWSPRWWCSVKNSMITLRASPVFIDLHRGHSPRRTAAQGTRPRERNAPVPGPVAVPYGYEAVRFLPPSRTVAADNEPSPVTHCQRPRFGSRRTIGSFCLSLGVPRRDSWFEDIALLDDQHCSVLAEDSTFSLDGYGDAQGDALHKPE